MTGDEIVQAVGDFLTARGLSVIPPDEHGDRPWNDPENPLVLVVDPVEHTLTAVRQKGLRYETAGQTT